MDIPWHTIDYVEIPWTDIVGFRVDDIVCDKARPCHHRTELTLADGSMVVDDHIDARQIAFLFETFDGYVPNHFVPYAIDEEQRQLRPFKRVVRREWDFATMTKGRVLEGKLELHHDGTAGSDLHPMP